MKHARINGSALFALALLACSNQGPERVSRGLPGDSLPASTSPRDVTRSLALSSARVAVVLPATALVSDVELPRLANGTAVVRDRASGMSVEFALAGANAARATVKDGVVTYRGGGPSGSDVVHVPGGAGTEDFVVFEKRPDAEAIEYEIGVGDAAGLRLVDGTLELLDGAGTPRLRMNAPFAVDRNGTRHPLQVALAGCAADVDPRGPWGRPITPPGRSTCTVRVAFGGDTALAYPLVVDPSWTATTGAMTSPRALHTATALADGKVLIVGGRSAMSGAASHLATAELFDPATNTFAATGSMTTARAEHVAVLLDSGDVFVALGESDAGLVGAAELYSVSTGKFTDAGATTPRKGARAVRLPDKSVLVAGGIGAANKILDIANTWSPGTAVFKDTGSLRAPRFGFFLGAQPFNVVAVGGGLAVSLGDLASSEFYNSGTWTALGTLSSVRRDLSGAVLDTVDTRVFVCGGYDISNKKTVDVAQWLGASDTKWSTPVKMATGRVSHTVTALPRGNALVTGGRTDPADATTALATVELYDGGRDAFVKGPALLHARSDHTATLLADGRVLVAGGDGGTGPVASAELYVSNAQGTACAAAAECATGFCVDGVCCGTACDGACKACNQAVTGKPSGTCSDAQAGKDPHSDCLDDGAPACTKNGLCDGKGACASYPSTPCSPSECKEDADCKSGHCVDGVCCDTACDGECSACTKAKTGANDGTCSPINAGTDPDSECGTLGTGSCRGAAACDGKSACRVSTFGKSCAAAACKDDVTLAAESTCAADGACTATTTSCDPYKCDAAAVDCKEACANDDDCADGAFCEAKSCRRKVNGEDCTASKQCASKQCVDGVCCESACDGQCEACNVSGQLGKCLAITGAPRGDRKPCDGEAPCRGTCNGVIANLCTYPGTDVICGQSASCSEAKESRDACNGFGVCVKGLSKDCTPYGCGEAACNTSCSSNGDCATGYVCDADGRCGSPSAAECPDGGTGPDCAKDTPKNDDGGCGCRTVANLRERGAGSGPESGGLLVVVALSLLGRRAYVRRKAPARR